VRWALCLDFINLFVMLVRLVGQCRE